MALFEEVKMTHKLSVLHETKVLFELKVFHPEVFVQ